MTQLWQLVYPQLHLCSRVVKILTFPPFSELATHFFQFLGWQKKPTTTKPYASIGERFRLGHFTDIPKLKRENQFRLTFIYLFSSYRASVFWFIMLALTNCVLRSKDLLLLIHYGMCREACVDLTWFHELCWMQTLYLGAVRGSAPLLGIWPFVWQKIISESKGNSETHWALP